ncbi:MAG: tetratricopeptide repeat protein [Terriglobia bacterium]
MQITHKNKPARIATAVIGVVVFIFLCFWVTRDYLATVIAGKPTVQNLQTAIHIDPGDARYPLSLGRLYQYTVLNAQPDLAIKNLTRAVQLNAYNPQAWLDLGTALEFEGNDVQAEECMRRADILAPRIPAFQWAIGNFFLLHNNLNEAFHHFQMVLAAVPYYDGPIFNTAWKASGDANAILSGLIPNNASANLRYLGYLLTTNRLEQAKPVWERLAHSPQKFSADGAALYMDVLIGAHQSAEAYKVWGTLRTKGVIPATDESTSQNLVENGDFEDPLLGIGFDWRIAGVAGVYVGLDDSTFHSPAKSLMIQFPGNQNVDYHNVYQLVPVLPSHRYHLLAYMKSQGITTDSGPRMEVRDAYNSALLDKYTDQLTGTTPAWVPLSLDFETGPKTDLLTIAIARAASQEFVNQIAGKFWVDDVTLTPENN